MKLHSLYLYSIKNFNYYNFTIHFKFRNYCTPSNVELSTEIDNTIDKASAKETVTKCLYSNVYDVKNLELGLARTKSGKSAGLDGEIKATYVTNTQKLKALSTKLKSHQYKPSPSKKV
jgi:hypothetical protein